MSVSFKYYYLYHSFRMNINEYFESCSRYHWPAIDKIEPQVQTTFYCTADHKSLNNSRADIAASDYLTSEQVEHFKLYIDYLIHSGHPLYKYHSLYIVGYVGNEYKPIVRIDNISFLSATDDQYRLYMRYDPELFKKILEEKSASRLKKYVTNILTKIRSLIKKDDPIHTATIILTAVNCMAYPILAVRRDNGGIVCNIIKLLTFTPSADSMQCVNKFYAYTLTSLLSLVFSATALRVFEALPLCFGIFNGIMTCVNLRIQF
jgi:hypothetical protein